MHSTSCKCCSCHSDNSASLEGIVNEENHKEEHGHSHSHNDEETEGGWKSFIGIGISTILLIAGVIIQHYNDFMTDNLWVKPLWYFIAFLPVGFPVIKEAFEGLMQKDYFNELTLMGIACIGAFCIGEYAEAVGVMLFYCIGENLQDRAVNKASGNISRLLSLKAEIARVVRDGQTVILRPEEVNIGDIIEVRAGERVPLDGTIMTDGGGMFNTAALTGESLPREIEKDGEVLAGMIPSSSTVRIKVNRLASESALSRILKMVKYAQSKKAKSEIFIRKFARIYTPIVTLLAFLVVVLPFFISLVHPSFHYVFSEWLYRSLVFLVISCPCALVISVPLSYFAGIGVASKYGILFKGGNYLDTIKDVNVVAFDKTGTLTTGEFCVKEVSPVNGFTKDFFLELLTTAENESNHPLAKAIMKFANEKGISPRKADRVQEIPGQGTRAEIAGNIILVGNLKLLKENGIPYPWDIDSKDSTIIALAYNGKLAGFVILADTIKSESAEAVKTLHKTGVEQIVMLSGDRKETVSQYAGQLGINEFHGELLPENKAQYVENLTKAPGKILAFVGDGLNDAPVLALSNIGIAMGGLGSDAAIESADVVIQTDSPARVATAIKIGRYTHKIVLENIFGALAVKVAVLTLGLLGIASLWAAVFADVGVTMLAVLNSMRIFHRKY